MKFYNFFKKMQEPQFVQYKHALMAKKCAYLDNLSTTTMITDLPIEIGNPLIKSREISAHTCVGICNG